MAKSTISLSQDELNAVLDYDPATGQFQSRKTGRKIGSIRQDGFVRVKFRIGDKIRLGSAHTLAWIMTYGTHPKRSLVHINGDKTDNRISNLGLHETTNELTPEFDPDAPKHRVVRKSQIPIDDAKRDLHYDPETGIFTCKITGKSPMGTPHSQGYLCIYVTGEQFLAHRLAWAMSNNEQPNTIDHINGDKSDNRLQNLRSVSAVENYRNQKKRARTKNDHVGVHWRDDRGTWLVRITVDKRSLYVGSYADLNEAITARREAEIKHGFHENHGRIE